MALLPIALILSIAVILLFFILRDLGIMNKKQKFIIGGGIILLGILIGVYSYHKSQEDKRNFLLQMAFLRGEVLICKDQKVSSKDFNLITGTLSLIGKENSDMKNITYKLEDCQSKTIETSALKEQLEKD